MNTIGDRIAELNPRDTYIANTDFYKWMAETDYEGRQLTLQTIQDYLTARGFVIGIDKLHPGQLETLRGIRRAFFYDTVRVEDETK